MPSSIPYHVNFSVVCAVALGGRDALLAIPVQAGFALAAAARNGFITDLVTETLAVVLTLTVLNQDGIEVFAKNPMPSGAINYNPVNDNMLGAFFFDLYKSAIGRLIR